MRRLASFLLTGAITVLAASGGANARPLEVFDVWGSFRATSSAIVDPHTLKTVKIERAAEPGARPGPEIWIAEQLTEISRSGELTTEHRWADSRTCPAMLPALASLSKLEPLSIQPPGVPWPEGRDIRAGSEREARLHGDGQIFDGGDFEIDAPGRWVAARMAGSVILRGGAGTPVAIWVRHALEALASCWSATEPS